MQDQKPTTAEESAAIERFASVGQGAPMSPKYGGPCVSRLAEEELAEEKPQQPTSQRKPTLRGK